MTHEPLPSNDLELESRTAGSDDSERTVVSKKPPQHWGGSGVDWRKVGESLLGRQLGSFRLESLLGTGGMGAVFQATDLQLDRQVAVKVINSDEDDPEANRRFRVEAQSAARLDHQNIARVFHVGQDQGWNFIVLELVSGQTLRQLVASGGPLTLPSAVHLFRQLASALGHAHRREIVHRDIKPSNVLVTDDGVVKIVDMGLARIQRSPDSTHPDHEEGMTLGTFDYIAPEQARDPRQADQQSDLYSLGCTLYYALTGRPPFEGTTIEKILCHSSSPRPKVTDLRPDLPASVDVLVGKLMAPRREDRIANAAELEQALAALLKRAPRPVKAVSQIPSPASKTHFPVAVLAVTAVLIFLSFILEANWQTAGVIIPEWPPESVESLATVATTRPADPSPESSANSGSGRAGSTTGLAESPSLLENNSGVGQSELNRGLPNFPFLGPNLPESETPFRYYNSSLIWRSLLGSSEGNENLSQNWWPFNERDAPNQADLVPLDPSRRPTLAPSIETEQVTTIQVVPVGIGGGARTPSGVTETMPGRSRYVQTATTLEEAISQLAKYPNVHTIELAFNGVQVVSGLKIPATGLREIQAAQGFRPILQFRQSDVEETPCLLLEGGNLELSNLDIVWETTRPGIQAPVSWLEAPTLDRVVVQNCTFTHIGTGDAAITGSSLRPTWFYVNTLPVSVIGGQKRGILQGTRAIFRGSSDVVHARYSQPVLMRFSHCWVATAAAGIHLGGKSPGAVAPGFEIDLEHCTWLTQWGLVRSQQTGGRWHSDFTMFAENCVLAALEPNVGLIDHWQANDSPPAEPSFSFDGFNNAFIARLIGSQTSRERGLIASTNFIQAQEMRWFQQDLARDLGDAYLLSQDKLRTMLQRSASQLEPANIETLWGSELRENGADYSKLPPFPTLVQQNPGSQTNDR